MKKLVMILVIVLMASVCLEAQEIGFSGDVSVVSTYVWRGIKQFDGAALQSTAEFSYGMLTIGYWMSSFNGPVTVETDPYVGLSLPIGPIETSVGATLYSYDFFAKREHSVVELNAMATFGPFSACFFYTPVQKEAYYEDALYWVDLTADGTVLGADLSATLSLGNYSAVDPNENATNLLLSAGKAVSEEIFVSWNWNVALSDGPENIFFLTGSYSF